MNTNDDSNTGLSEVKNTGLKSIYEKILYSKVFGAIGRQSDRFGIDSVQKTVKYDGFYKKVLSDSFYAKAIDGMFDSVIRRVVNQAQSDYLDNNQETYQIIQNEINKKK